jgi:hypothetical protein
MASNEEVKNEQMRSFSTGATRNVDTERIDPEGFLAPSVLESYFGYMHKNRFQKDGKLRDSDNWQLGIPQKAYVKSLWRHFFDLWTQHRFVKNHLTPPSPYRNEKLIEDCNAIMFNTMGYLFEELKKPTKEEVYQKAYGMNRPLVTGRLRSQLLEDASPAEEEFGYGSGV